MKELHQNIIDNLKDSINNNSKNFCICEDGYCVRNTKTNISTFHETSNTIVYKKDNPVDYNYLECICIRNNK